MTAPAKDEARFHLACWPGDGVSPHFFRLLPKALDNAAVALFHEGSQIGNHQVVLLHDGELAHGAVFGVIISEVHAFRLCVGLWGMIDG